MAPEFCLLTFLHCFKHRRVTRKFLWICERNYFSFLFKRVPSSQNICVYHNIWHFYYFIAIYFIALRNDICCHDYFKQRVTEIFANIYWHSGHWTHLPSTMKSYFNYNYCIVLKTETSKVKRGYEINHCWFIHLIFLNLFSLTLSNYRSSDIFRNLYELLYEDIVIFYTNIEQNFVFNI